MSAYFDTSVISKWYVPESDSAAALALAKRFPPPAFLTHLHRVELAAAWNLKVFRKDLRTAEVSRALDSLEADVRTGVWSQPDYDLVAAHEAAESLARRHSASLGARTLDILHVANALVLAARDFVTGDKRQAKLARAVGLKVIRLGAA